VGTDVAAALLVAAGDNPDRLKNESSFAAMAGVSPLPDGSGKPTVVTDSTPAATATPITPCGASC
jgi:hypothetical protein